MRAHRMLVFVAWACACQADPLSLDGRSCEKDADCVSGWVCDTARSVCAKQLSDSGTSGTSGASGVSGAGGTVGGAGGAGGSGGVGGSGTGGTSGGAGSSGASGSGGGAGSPPCSATVLDCDGDPNNGCETDIDSDRDHCGACQRACSSDGVDWRRCNAGKCESSCSLGRANCSLPAAPEPDDGCETDATLSASCGGCGNACDTSAQAAQSCGADALCSCAGNDQACLTGGGSATCDASGACVCGGVTCARGEVCFKQGPSTSCVCNGAGACSSGQTCCQSPKGCRDLASDPLSCGACGRSCAPGWVCVAGDCKKS